MDQYTRRQAGLAILGAYDDNKREITYLEELRARLLEDLSSLPSSFSFAEVNVKQFDPRKGENKIARIVDQISEIDERIKELEEEQARFLQGLEDALSGEHALAIKLRHQLGYTFKVIGESMHLSESAACRLYWDGVEALVL